MFYALILQHEKDEMETARSTTTFATNQPLTTRRRRRTPPPPLSSSSGAKSSSFPFSSVGRKPHAARRDVFSFSFQSLFCRRNHHHHRRGATATTTASKHPPVESGKDGRIEEEYNEGQTTRTRRYVAVAFGACLSAFSATIGTQDEPSEKGRTLTLGRRRQSNGVVEAAEFKGQQQDCENCSNSNTSLREGDKKFATSPSGLRYIDLREGDGTKVPKRGDVVVVDWVGYTAGYQAKKIESTRDTDAPFTFTVGSGEAIPAFDEAVLTMGKGGVKRIEIAGELEETLGYSRNPKERYDGVGPKPTTFGGLRALDFVLDNKTLKDFNRTLLFDVKLVSIRNSS